MNVYTVGRYLKHILQLILSPRHGWEDIERDNPDPQAIASSGFYPLTALTSVTVFIQAFYDSTVTLPALLIDAIVTFTAYFLGYFIACFIFDTLASRFIAERDSLTTRRFETFSLYILGMIELVTIINNCLPVKVSLILFLPIYIVIIIWFGRDFMRAEPERRTNFLLIAFMALMVPAPIVTFLFNLLLT